MKKNLIYLIIGIFILSLTIFASYFFLTNKTHLQSPAGSAKTISPTPLPPTPTPDPLAPFAIALLGYGGGNHQGAMLTDSILIARIDPRQQKVFLISVPRDLWVYLPLESDSLLPFKINSAYAWGNSQNYYQDRPPKYQGKFGGGNLAKDTLSQIVGFPINNFLALDFQGFVQAVDLLGGISVDVQRSFQDPFYPLEDPEIDEKCGRTDEEITALTATLSGTKLEEMFPCRYQTLTFEQGTQLMDGQTALKFVRSRHSPTDGGDFARSERQKLVITAIKNRLISLDFIPKIIPLINTLSYHLQTDIALKDIDNYLSQSVNFSNYQIINFSINEENLLSQSKSANGQFILIPQVGETDYSQIQSSLNQLFQSP